VAWITLSSPERHNRLHAAMSAELRDCCMRSAQDPHVRAVVVEAEGDDFCAGAEDRLPSQTAQDYMVQMTVAPALAALPVPVIAVLQGQALDLGLELALAADLRIAAQSARLGLTNVLRGQMPWDGGTQRLPRLVGQGRALELLLTGRLVDAEEAARIGLVHQVVATDQLPAVAAALAQELAQRAPLALRYAKEAALRGLDHTLEQGLRLEADLYFLLFSTEDRLEGLKSWREKRPPSFQGR